MTKSLRTLGIIAALTVVVMILGAATMHPLGAKKQWAITASWAKSKRLGEYVSYNPVPETLAGAEVCTTSGYFTTAGNRIYIDGTWRGDTTAAGAKDSVAGTVYLDCAMDTAFATIIYYDSFTFAESTLVKKIKDSLDIVLGAYCRFRVGNLSADTTGSVILYGNSPDGYFVD